MAIFNTVYGGEWKWKPWANTLAYYELTTDASDSSWNSNDATNHWATFSSDWAYFDVGYYIQLPKLLDITEYTINVWLKTPTHPSWNQGFNIYNDWGWANRNIMCLVYASTVWGYLGNGSTNQQSYGTSINTWTWWNNIVLSRNGTNLKIYVNWNKELDTTVSYSPVSSGSNTIYIGTEPWGWSSYNCAWYLKDYIIEDVQWTDQEVLDYYNNTKANYWL